MVSRDAADAKVAHHPRITAYLQGLYSVVDLLECNKVLPTCSRLANEDFQLSCANLDGDGSDERLEHDKRLYATRLAICELQEADNTIPRECSLFVPVQEKTTKTSYFDYFGNNAPSKPILRYPAYEDLTDFELRECTAALGTKPHWWTSYSNAKQNGIVMCGAIRAHTEKGLQYQPDIVACTNHRSADSLIAFVRTLVELGAQAPVALAQAEAQMQALYDMFKVVVSAVEEYQNRMSQDLDDARGDLQHFRAELKSQLADLEQDFLDATKNVSRSRNDGLAAAKAHTGNPRYRPPVRHPPRLVPAKNQYTNSPA